jgi:hypothetical protein
MSEKQQRKSVSRSAALTIPELEKRAWCESVSGARQRIKTPTRGRMRRHAGDLNLAAE